MLLHLPMALGTAKNLVQQFLLKNFRFDNTVMRMVGRIEGAAVVDSHIAFRGQHLFNHLFVSLIIFKLQFGFFNGGHNTMPLL